MSKTIIWELVAKKLAGEATIEELGELEQLLRANPDMHYPLQTVADLWHQSTPDTENAQSAYTTHAGRMKEMGIDIQSSAQITSQPIHRSSKTKYLLGAIACLIFIAGIYAFGAWITGNKPAAKSPTDKSEVSTRYGSRTKLLLPDGTQVWLNSGSKLSYDKTYGNTNREVALAGEAYFDVVKNAAHPFVIHTTSIDIRVLGTAFNVKSFPGEKNTETSLIRGSIEVTFKNRPAEKIILKPNEKLITANEEPVKDTQVAIIAATPVKTAKIKEPAKEDALVTVSHLTYDPGDSTAIETSWMDNKLIFRSETFEDLALRMERWYGVTIHFADDKIRPKKLNGIFENESVQQALKALQLITPFSYTINKTEILIASK